MAAAENGYYENEQRREKSKISSKQNETDGGVISVQSMTS